MTIRKIRAHNGFFEVTFFESGSVSLSFNGGPGESASIAAVENREEVVFFLRKLLDEVNFGPSKV